MRRAIALALITFFSSLLMAPLFASDGDANLPACCRRHGKHHCTMPMMDPSQAGKPGFASITEKCPCQPAITCAVHSAKFKPASSALIYAAIVRHPASVAQTEALLRLSFLRTQQKRGPPTPLA